MTLKISEGWYWIKRITLYIIVAAVFGVILWAIFGGLDKYTPSYRPSKDFPSNDQPLYSFLGYYNGKSIVIYPYKAVDSQDYIQAAWHEWAHYIWNNKLSAADIKLWLNLTRTCGIDNNAKKYRSSGVRVAEDYAYSYALYKVGYDGLCQQKEDFLARWP
jgi:NADH:ubiquinone oxidoreductase subunit